MKIHSNEYTDSTTVIESRHAVHLLNRLQLYHICHDEDAHTMPSVLRAFFSLFVPSLSRLQENKLSFIISLRTFALIVTAHPYCASLLPRNSWRHVKHHTSYVSAKEKYKQASGLVQVLFTSLAIYSLKWSVTPSFLFIDHFCYWLSPL